MLTKILARINDLIIENFNLDNRIVIKEEDKVRYRNALICQRFLEKCSWFSESFKSQSSLKLEIFRNIQKLWNLPDNITYTSIGFDADNDKLLNVFSKFDQLIAKVRLDLEKAIYWQNQGIKLTLDTEINSESSIFPIQTWENQIFSDPWLKDLMIFTELIQQLRFESVAEDQKHHGSYYTPASIIVYIIENILVNGKSKNRSNSSKILSEKEQNYQLYASNGSEIYRFLDLACGMGGFLFLTAAFGALIHQKLLQIVPNDKSELFPKWEYLGLDMDLDALNWAKFILEILVLHPIFGTEMQQIRFQETNSLFPLTSELIQSTPENMELGTRASQQAFDFILSNPPYVSWGLGRVGSLDKSQEQYYRANFPNSAEYKISLYALFIERSVQLLRPGGVGGLILPDSFLAGKYFAKLRLFLLNTCRLRHFVLFQRNFWKNVETGNPVILIFQKYSSDDVAITPNSPPETIVRSAILAEENLQILKTNMMNQEYFRDQPKFRFRLFFSPETAVFVQTMEADSHPISMWFEAHHGIRSRTGIGKARITNKSKEGPDWKPAVISGNAVTPYHIEYQGQFILTNPEYLFSGGFNPEHIEQEKILIRRTGDSLIAAVDTERFYHPNTLIYLIPKAQARPPMSLYALCAILNSEVMNAYYHAISMKKQRSMAQIEIDTLEQLPLKIDYKILSELDSSARLLHSLRDESIIHPPSQKMRKQIDDLLQLVNLSVKVLFLKEK